MGSTTHARPLSCWPADTSEELRERSVGDALRESAAEAPDHPAIIEGTPGPGPCRQLTYAELLTAAEQAARSASYARGYLVMSGYYDNQQATVAAIDGEGWYRIGGLAAIAADGCVGVEGRLMDTIICGEENIYPKEIENLLQPIQQSPKRLWWASRRL